MLDSLRFRYATGKRNGATFAKRYGGSALRELVGMAAHAAGIVVGRVFGA